MADGTTIFKTMMDRIGQPQRAAGEFLRMYSLWREGGPPHIPWDSITPPEPSRMADHREIASQGFAKEAPLDGLAWIILNGGIGTSMRMEQAKSLVRVKGGKSFLDLIAGFALDFRARTGAKLPVIFMDSYRTREGTLAALEKYPLKVPGVGLDFMQHRFPRVRRVDGAPFGPWENNASWAPPGHGDIYLSLLLSGTLDGLLGMGIKWAFVSNADNLGASPDPALLGYMARTGMEFMLEVTPRTPADVKGGALIGQRGTLMLLEAAQVEKERVEEFGDALKFPMFNTNNAWMDLSAVKRLLMTEDLNLPLIVNGKNIDGVEVVQLEHAMGAAIGSFERTAGIVVDRSRFAPVKTTDDLLVRRSDTYIPGEDSPLAPSPRRDASLGVLKVSLDPNYFCSAEDLDLRVPKPLHLLESTSLTVVGDVRFGEGVRVKGAVTIKNEGDRPLLIPDFTLLEGEI